MASSPETYQHYRVSRSLDRFHREFGCETHHGYTKFDLVRYVLGESGLLILVDEMESSPGKVSITYYLDSKPCLYDVDIRMCMETAEATQRLEKWRDQDIGSGTAVTLPKNTIYSK